MDAVLPRVDAVAWITDTEKYHDAVLNDAYLRRWLPELRRLPDQWIHRPWEAPPAVLAAADVSLGRDYPRPIVDFYASRTSALAAYGSIKAPSAPVRAS